MKKKLNGFLLIGIIGLAVFGTQLITNLISAFAANKNIWWTPKTMQLTLEESKNNFEIFIMGEPLQKHFNNGSLCIIDADGKQYHLFAKDIGVRLNNWKSHQVSILKNALINSFVTGIGVTCLIIGLWKLRFKKEKPLENK